uniref:BTB domain-containing protein n=1 Tax=Panagrellus redivivus TaxID=6233 RepID=A0A7E5A1G9_PANRE
MAPHDRYSSKNTIFTDTVEIELEEVFFRTFHRYADPLRLPRRNLPHGFSWDLLVRFDNEAEDLTFIGTFHTNRNIRYECNLSTEVNGLRMKNGIFRLSGEADIVIFAKDLRACNAIKNGRFTVKVSAVVSISYTLLLTSTQLKRLTLSEVLGASDLTLTVQGRKIPVHKSILCSSSTVISAMFDHDTKEARENNINIVDFDFKAVQSAIDYIYGKEVLNPTASNATEMHRFFDKYMIKCAADKLLAWLKDNISVDNFWSIQKYAWEVSQDELKTASIQFYRANTMLTLTDKFRQLGHDVMFEFISEA